MARGIWVYAVAATIRSEWFGRPDGIGVAHLPVAPMPPGTIYPDEATVIRILAARRTELTIALNVTAATAKPSAPPSYRVPPYPATFSRIPVSHVNQVGCG
jgi:hypothetical protein